MFSSPQNNNRVKIINKLVLSNCFLLGQTSKLTNKNFTRYLLGIRYSLEIFKLYEIRHLLLRVYPLIYNLFCRDRNLYDRMILRRYPKKIKKKRFEEFQKINPNRDGKMRFYTFRIRKNIPPKILFVSSTPQYADIVEEAALRCQMP
jgi:ribosomal protein S2